MFIPEYKVKGDRHFSLDIAFPSLKIGIEINGRQHYDSNYELKPYYQERQKYFELLDWKIVNIYYKKVYDKEIINMVLDLLNNHSYKSSIFEKDFESYKLFLIQKEKDKFCKCGNKKHMSSNECKKCSYKTRKVFSKEEKQTLIDNVSTKGYLKYAKELGISDNALRKRALKYGLNPKLLSPYSHG